jgi:hypothetical protein
MSKKNTSPRIAVAAALCMLTTAPVFAQTSDASPSTSLPTQCAVTGETNHIILLVSAAVLLIGLTQDDSTLTLLGGAGVLVSLFSGPVHNHPAVTYQRSFAKSGPLSLGMQTSFRGESTPRSAPYLQFTTKF